MSRHLLLAVSCCSILTTAMGDWDIPVPLEPDSSGVGTLPFDWSGHWGIAHIYGFPGWGQDNHLGPIWLDGNFAHWPRRYAFPSRKWTQSTDEESTVQSAVWYRRGDFHLDEFALDVNHGREGSPTTRFQALKRNFDDQYGLLGPTAFRYAGGTIQQNYRLSLAVPEGSGPDWKVSSAYFKTTDAIPFPGDLTWEKGAVRSDRILANGLSYHGEKVNVNASAFSQRLRTRRLADLPSWSVDLIAYRLQFVVGDSSSSTLGRFLKGSAKYSAMSSDSLGDYSRLEVSGSAGFTKQSVKFKVRGAMGGVYVSPDRWGIVADGHTEYFLSGSDRILVSASHSLYALPFQFAVSHASAISQERSIVRLAFDHRSPTFKTEAGIFGSRAAPHYFFENRPIIDLGPDGWYTFRLVEEQDDTISGLFLSGNLNYFRRWRVDFRGISILENRRGWGNGVQHEARMTLSFREFLFDGRMDLGMQVTGNVWAGRRSYVWDPHLGMGFEDYRKGRELYPQNWSGVMNARFEAVVSTFEIAFTMVNVLFSGRGLIESVTGSSLSPEELTLTATPLFPNPGRLAFLEFSWRFSD